MVAPPAGAVSALSEAAKQDISEFFQPISAILLEKAAKRFGFALPGSFTDRKASRIERLLGERGLSAETLPFLSHLMEGVPSSDLPRAQKAFLSSPLEVVVSGPHLGIVIRSSGSPVEETVATYLEKHAPGKFRKHVAEAEHDLATGSWASAASHSRLALDGLTKSGQFDAALQELVKEKLIQERSAADLKYNFDKELLKVAYGYLGTVGHHTSSGRPPISPDQALLAVSLALNCGAFLVRIITAGRTGGLALTTWWPAA